MINETTWVDGIRFDPTIAEVERTGAISMEILNDELGINYQLYWCFGIINVRNYHLLLYKSLAVEIWHKKRRSPRMTGLCGGGTVSS